MTLQDIAVFTGQPVVVYRPEGRGRVYLTFEGLRESRTVGDKLTRIRVAIPLAEAARLRDLLTEQISAQLL